MADASIPLGVRPPIIDSPIDAQSRALNLQGMAQSVQLNQAKLQEERLKAQSLEEDRRDNDLLRKAYAESPGDMKAVRLKIAPQINPRNLKLFDQSTLEHASGMAKMEDDKLKIQAARSGELSKRLSSVMEVQKGDTSPAAIQARAAEWAKQATLAKAHNLDPDNEIPLEYPGDDGSSQYDVLLRGSKVHMDEELARRDAQTKADKELREKAKEVRDAAAAVPALAEAETKAAVAQQQRAAAILAVQKTPEDYAAHLGMLKPEVAAMFPPADKFDPATTPDIILKLGQTPEQQVTAAQAKETAAQNKIRLDLEAKNQQIMRSQGAERIALERQAQALREKQFNATLGSGLDANGQPRMGPDGKPIPSAAAQMIANYEVAPPSSYLLARNPGLMEQVKAANPGYDGKNYESAKNIRVSKGGNIQALNTAVVHMDQLGDVSAALQNGSFKPGNALWNVVREAFGSSAPTNFEGLKNAVAGEMASALKGSATDIEIHNISKTINAANSPKQLADAMNENFKILAAKLNTYDEQYHQAVGAKDPWHPVLPTAGEVLKKHSVGQRPEISGGNLPQGAGKVIDSDTAKKFYEAAGNDPARARKLATDNGWKLQ